ncbi:hypothetical protein BGX26_010829, partial [Mortierella sp. AD094]
NITVTEHGVATTTPPSPSPASTISTSTIPTTETTGSSTAETISDTTTGPSAETTTDVSMEATAESAVETISEGSEPVTPIVVAPSAGAAASTTGTTAPAATVSPIQKKQSQPSVAAIVKNARHIRFLSYSGRLSEEYFVKVPFPQLRRLKLVELKLRINDCSDSNGISTATSVSQDSNSEIGEEKRQTTDPEMQVDALKVVEAREPSALQAESGTKVDVEAQSQSKLNAWIIYLLGVSPLLECMIVEEMAGNAQVLLTVRDISQVRMLIWSNIINDDSWKIFRQPKQRISGQGSGRLEQVCTYGWDKDGNSVQAGTRYDTFETIKTIKLCCLTGRRAEFLYQMRLVKMCAYLESLCWHLTKDSDHGVKRPPNPSIVDDSIFLSKDFDEMCVAYTWQKHLRKIDLDLPGLGDQELTRFLASITAGNLENLTVRSSRSFGPMSLYCLRTLNHFLELQHVNLKDTSFGEQFSNDAMLEILESCPKLTYFSGSSLMAKSLLNNKEPWVCQGLKVLEIHISFATNSTTECRSGVENEEEMRTLRRLVFNRLATLKALETLEICTVEERRGEISCVDASDRNLDWRIESGMDQLGGLKQLRRIRVGAGQEMEREDVVWILENWSNLETVVGGLHKDELQLAMLKTIFIDRGINVLLK